MQRDRCPHRSVPLSRGVHLGDRVACNYHGVQVDGTGTVVSVPGSPGCALEGRLAVATYPATEVGGAIWAWIGETGADPAPLHLPEQLTGDEWEAFLCYVEWDAPYGFSLDNLMDPMHGAFLHRDSHTMFGGKREAVFQVRDTPTGFVFEKTDQKLGELRLVGVDRRRLPGRPPRHPVPGDGRSRRPVRDRRDGHADRRPPKHAAFFWRCRRVTGWQRDSWRVPLPHAAGGAALGRAGAGPGDARRDAARRREREGLYQHDIALVRVRRLLRNRAESLVRDRAVRTDPAARLAAAR